MAIQLAPSINVIHALLRLKTRGGMISLTTPSYTNGLNSATMNSLTLNGAGMTASSGSRTIGVPTEPVMALGSKQELPRLSLKST